MQIKQGTKLELPLWLAEMLAVRYVHATRSAQAKKEVPLTSPCVLTSSLPQPNAVNPTPGDNRPPGIALAARAQRAEGIPAVRRPAPASIAFLRPGGAHVGAVRRGGVGGRPERGSSLHASLCDGRDTELSAETDPRNRRCRPVPRISRTTRTTLEAPWARASSSCGGWMRRSGSVSSSFSSDPECSSPEFFGQWRTRESPVRLC